MHFRSDPEKHQQLIDELHGLFRSKGYRIIAGEGIPGLPLPRPLPNDGYGDQENKAPDLHAFDEQTGCTIIGEAKTGAGDFETEHALTQYNVFLDQFDKQTGAPAILFIIVPASSVPAFNTLMTHYIHPDYWAKIVLVPSESTPS